MTGLTTCLFLLFVSSAVIAYEEEAVRSLDADLTPWSRLKRNAGYLTESGRWRGGLYRQVMQTETEHYHCLSHTDTHCTMWSVSETGGGKHETGTCMCEETAYPFCQQWSCNTSYEYSCGTEEQPATCLRVESLNCSCEVAAENERYCWKWRCREDSNIMPGGYHEYEDYVCDVGDFTAEYCFRWHGNTSSKYQLESSACECFERGSRFCEAWLCRERGISRCEQHGRGWCRVEIAIGVGGGLGLLLFLACRGCFCAYDDGTPEGQSVPAVLCHFAICCLPWLSGVLVWGGTFGLPWVIPVWTVALGVALCVVKRRKTQRNPARIELPTLRMKRTQVMDDGESDNPNDEV